MLYKLQEEAIMKLFFTLTMTALMSFSSFAGQCELQCAGENLRCVKYASSDRDYGMCDFAFKVCQRDCRGGGSVFNLKSNLKNEDIDFLQESLEDMREMNNAQTYY